MFFFFLGQPLLHVPVKRHRGEPGPTHGTHTPTGHTVAHTGTPGSHRRTSKPSKPNDTPTRPRDGRNRARLNSRRHGADHSPRPTSGRLRRGRPQQTRPCLHPLPERLPALESTCTGKKTPGGAGTHTRDTHAHTRTYGSHRRTSQPSKPNDTPARPRTVYAVTKFKPECSKALRCFLLSDTALCETAVSLSLRFPGPEKAPTHS